MAHGEEDWSRWASDWQERGRSLAPLVARVRSERARWSRALAVEGLAGLAVVAFYVWILTRGASPPVVAVALASMAFVSVWLTVFVRAARAARAAAARPLAEFVDAALEQQRARLAWYRFARSSSVAFFAFAVLWSPWMLWTHRALYVAQPWRAAVGFGGVAVISAALWWALGRSIARARAGCEAIEALRGERDEEDR